MPEYYLVICDRLLSLDGSLHYSQEFPSPHIILGVFRMENILMFIQSIPETL